MRHLFPRISLVGSPRDRRSCNQHYDDGGNGHVPKCLSFHADYRCRHSGACCRAGWTIPFDRREYHEVESLRLTAGSFIPAGDGVMLATKQPDGQCTFFSGSTHLCAIQHTGGHAALPLTCRMFPRLVLSDARGTFISLSHFCPTAASLLFEADGSATPVAIVDAPATLVDVGTLDGLDARDAWPPLLRPGVLMDLESYGVWERLAIALLTRPGIAPLVSLDALRDTTDRIAGWTPGSTELLFAVHDAFGVVAPPTDVLEPHDPAVKRWLAARLFGAWIAYQGDGLQTTVRYLRLCHDTFARELARDGNPLETIRRSDLLLIHQSDSQQLADSLNT
jgi:Fe-S-cluster containining protein